MKYVLLILMGLLILFCMSGPVVAVSFRGGKLDWCVRYCGIKIFPRPEKKSARRPKKAKKAGRSRPKKSRQAADGSRLTEPEVTVAATQEETRTAEEEISGNQEATKPETKSRQDYYMDKLWKKLQSNAEKADFAGNVLRALPGPLKRLARGISWYAIETDFLIAGEDAAECALLYGRVQSLLHPLLAQSGTVMKVKRKKMIVVCDFTEDKCRWDFSCKFRIRIGTVLASGITLVWIFLTERIKTSRQTSGTRI